jgi:hypothetical protein
LLTLMLVCMNIVPSSRIWLFLQIYRGDVLTFHGLARAEDILYDEVSVTTTDSRNEAMVRDYRVVIDEQAGTIKHDCADWEKSSALKKFCKHLDKMVLMIARKKATELLEKIVKEKDDWQFSRYMR